MVDKEIQKYIKKVRDDANEDMKLHLGALNELHGETLKAIKEESVLTNIRLGRMEKTLDVHTEMIGELKEDVSVLKEDVSVLKEDVSVLKEDVSVLKEDVFVLKEDVSVLKEDVSVLKEDVSILKIDVKDIKLDMKSKIDKEDFFILSKKVASLV